MKKKSVLLAAVAMMGLTAATMAQVPDYVPTQGLVGWWPFNGNANDESGNGNNGTVNGATLAEDRFGQAKRAYFFDGNDWIELNQLAAINNSSELTVSVWVKSTGFNSNTLCSVGCAQFYFSRGYDGGDGFCVAIGQGNNPKFFSSVNGFFAGGKGPSDPSTTPIPHTSWNHLVLRYDGALVTLFVNGRIVGSVDYSNKVGVGKTSNAAFGRQFIPTFPYFTVGFIDDAAIWNRALTPEEITDLYYANLCFQTISVTDTLFINTGISGFNPVTFANTIKIYPNPASTHITIDYGNIAILNGYRLRITNSLGQEVFQTAITQPSEYLDLSGWGGNGLYFVYLIDPHGNILDVRKIVLR